MEILKALWAYRSFVAGSVKRELQSKYRNSVLGAAWVVINPLAMILVYTIIFSQVMRAKLPGVDHVFGYSIYLCAGLLTWSFFSEVVSRGQNVFIENANLLKKINFPKISLPVISVLNASVNFSIIFSLFLVFLWVSGSWPGWPVLATVPVLLVELMLAVGLGVTLGVLNVFFRDVGQFFAIFLQFWFWATPVIYPVSVLPTWVQPLMAINPMYSVIQAYQGIFVAGLWPEWGSLIYPMVLGMMFCGAGLLAFRRHSSDMVDEL